MLQSESTTELFAALAEAQAACRPASKDKVNPHFKTKYADLASIWDAIRDACRANKLSVVQEITWDQHGIAITTQINHASGQWVRLGPLVIPMDKPTAQGAGSAVSYGKRYALAAAFGVVAEDDDDGNAATAPARRPVTKAADTPPANGVIAEPARKFAAEVEADIEQAADLADLAAVWKHHEKGLAKLKADYPKVYAAIAGFKDKKKAGIGPTNGKIFNDAPDVTTERR